MKPLKSSEALSMTYPNLVYLWLWYMYGLIFSTLICNDEWR